MAGYVSFADLTNITQIVTKRRILPLNDVPWKGLIIAVQILSFLTIVIVRNMF
jgi:hypothetical protein